VSAPGDEAEEEVRLLVEHLQLEGRVNGYKFADLSSSLREELLAEAARIADEGEKPFEAARAAVRTILRAIP